LTYYPPEARLTAVEPSPEMISLARERQRALGREIDLQVGDAERLEFGEVVFGAPRRQGGHAPVRLETRS
jgi:ubiquinone/menaquinone biosynthesis C-methylase UbiE